MDAYRGAGRPEATYVIERAMDLFAAEIGMDRAELRRRNFIAPDKFPYENPSGLGTASGGAKIYIDSGDYEPAMDKALATVGYEDLAAKKAEAKTRGKLLGLGLSRPTSRSAASRRPSGSARSARAGAPRCGNRPTSASTSPARSSSPSGTQPQGQGHETTYAQVIAHELGIPMEDVIVQHSDTQGTPFGYGSYGTRTSSVGMTAAIKAADKITATRRASTPRTCSRRSPDDIEIDRCRVPRQGLARPKKTIQEIAFALDLAFDAPEGMEPYLDETAYYDTPNCTWPFGTHIAIVEIDEETGNVELVRYVAVDDVGKKINPMIVDGQLHGGIAQGVGQALWEGAIYSDDGQLLTGSMLDYALPRAVVVPAVRARRDRHPVAGQPARGQGRRRGRGHRQHRRRRQCGRRRAEPLRDPSSRHAVHAADRVARHPVREGRPGMIPAAFDYQRPATLERRSAPSRPPVAPPRSSRAARACCR